MKEYGGYIELDTYALPMLHEGAIALNCGRNCLAYVLKERKIKRLWLPAFLCDSVAELCNRLKIEVFRYEVDEHFLPEPIYLAEDEWLYLVNFYGQLEQKQILDIKMRYHKVIVDNAQAYFDEPIPDTDTIYTCRKFLGVPDGAFLYTDAVCASPLSIDESFERMHYLLGRYERSASEFYQEYTANNHLFSQEPIKQMSKLTRNLLHGIDYKVICNRRTENFVAYHEILGNYNQLKLRMINGAFAYPLLLDQGNMIRKELQSEKIYVPTLWPNVLKENASNTLAYHFAENILPLPCDQRYTLEDIGYIAQAVIKRIK